MQQAKFSDLKGKTILSIVQPKDEDNYDTIIFFTNDGCIYRMYHFQDCCEEVYLEDICGDLKDLLGTPIVCAEEVSNNIEPAVLSSVYGESLDGEGLWTFYKLSTIKGTVTLRWVGTSNGYYSVTVDFQREEPNAN